MTMLGNVTYTSLQSSWSAMGQLSSHITEVMLQAKSICVGNWNYMINTRDCHLHIYASTKNDIKNYVELGHHLWMLHWRRGLGEWICPHLQLPPGTKAVAKDLNWRLLLSIHSKKLGAITSSKLPILRPWITLSYGLVRIQRFTTTSFCLSSCQEDYEHIASIVTECDGTTKLIHYKSDAPSTNTWVETWNLLYDEHKKLSSPHASTRNDIKEVRGLSEWIWQASK